MNLDYESEPVAPRLRRAVWRISRHLRATEAGADLTPTQSSVLGALERRGPSRLSELAAVEAVNPTMLSRVVRRLEEAGLARRLPDPGDGRASLLEVTALGRRLCESIRTERTDQLNLELANLEPDDLRTLVAALPVLEKLADRLRTAAGSIR
jgi:DNA-binding MarR family transcriptional regulator